MNEFRAYDKIFKTLIYSFPEGYSLDLEGNVINEEMGVVNHNWIIESYIKAKDKNGTKLFVGDKIFDHGSKKIFIIVESDFQCAFKLEETKTGEHFPISKNICSHRYEKTGTIHDK